MKRIMKIWTTSLLLIAAFAANAQQKQSLKDLLYSGKLKSDSGSVVRRDDDLTTKIDTATKKPVAPEQPKVITAAAEPEKTRATTALNDPEKKATSVATEGTASTKAADTAAAVATESSPAAAPVKSNAKIWKEYTDALLSSLKTDLLPNKKIKKDDYFVIVEYELQTDGKINVLSVTSSPENALLQSEIKNRLDNAPPELAPSLDSTGKPKKLKRKQSFTVTKE